MSDPTATTGTINFVAFIDADGDGLRDAGEPLYSNREIYLVDAPPGEEQGSGLPGVLGPQGYDFGQLTPGSYRLGTFLPGLSGSRFLELSTVEVRAGAVAKAEYAVQEPEPVSISVREDSFVFVATTFGRDPATEVKTTPTDGTLVVGPGGRSGSPLYYVPDKDFVGTDSFLVEKPGTNNLLPTRVEITITPEAELPDAPAAADDSGFVISPLSDNSTTISFQTLLGNDSGTGLRVLGFRYGDGAFLETTPDDLGVTVYANGVPGPTRFAYAVVDDTGQVDFATVTVQDDLPESGYVRGTSSADVMDFSRFPSRVQIAGLSGNDTLRGGSANDALNGGSGNDVISGGAGADLITGGTGADRISGGAGNDTFLIARGDLTTTNATDLIVDFQGAGVAGGDLIRLTGFGAGATLGSVGAAGNATAYEVHDADGASLGRLLVSSGGTPLAAGDYVFA